MEYVENEASVHGEESTCTFTLGSTLVKQGVGSQAYEKLTEDLKMLPKS